MEKLVKKFGPFLWAAVSLIGIAALVGLGEVSADQNFFLPGNLVVSRSVYDNNANNVTVGMQLPPVCVVSASCVAATNDGAFPFVFNNAAPAPHGAADGSFGITSPIFLDQITTSGTLVNTLEIPNSSQKGVPPTKDQMVTSFSSKSEISLNLSTDGSLLTFMGYLAPVDTLDVSNSNTPTVVDSTNPVGENFYRVVASVDSKGQIRYTLTNAYSGNNGPPS